MSWYLIERVQQVHVEADERANEEAESEREAESFKRVRALPCGVERRVLKAEALRKDSHSPGF